MMEQNAENKLPVCVGIIMDGNRRWAKEKGLLALEGHTAGYEKLKEVVRWAKELGVRNLVFYAFSTENWQRTQEEVSYLMDIFRKALSDEMEEIKKEGMRIKFVGQREKFSPDLQEMMKKTEEDTKDFPNGTVGLAVSYGGRPEILMAVNKLLKEGKKEASEEEFSNALWTAGIPDPDAIIRTSGEERLSGFLPWQGVYSELFFTRTYWPDFSKEEFQNILKEFAERERRNGK